MSSAAATDSGHGPRATGHEPASGPDATATSAGGQVARAAGIIGAMVLLSRVLGLARDVLITSHFGQTAITDAFIYAFTLPDTLWMLVAGGAFYAAFVPVITEYFTHGREEDAWKTYSIITTFLFVVLSVVIPLCWIFARPLLDHFLAPNLTDDTIVKGFGRVHPLSMAVRMTRIVLPAQYCFFLGTLMMGMLQARQRFLMPALGPVIYNIGIICGGLLFHGRLGIAAFSWGALAGALMGNLLLQAWALQSLRPRFRPSLELSFPGVKRAGKLVLPVIFGVSLPQATAIVNGIFVAHMESARTILEYTNRLMQLPLGIFGQAIGIAVLPMLSRQAAQDDLPRFRATLAYGVRLALFLTVPASALMMVLASPLITMVYERGRFSALDTAYATPALVLFSVGVAAWSAQAVVARAFYARNDTWTPVIAGTAVTFLIFIPLNFLLQPLFHVPGKPLVTRGPALSASLASIANVAILLLFAHRRFGGIHGREILLSLARMLLAAGVAAAGAAALAGLVARVIGPGHARAASQLLGGSALGLALYLGAAHLLGAREPREALAFLRRKAAL